MLESLFSGGVLGLLGSIASNVFGFFKAKQEHSQRVESHRWDMKAAENEHRFAMEQITAEATHKRDQLVIESDRAESVAGYEAMIESYKQDQAYEGDSSLLVIAEFIRRITRPLLTFILVFLTTGIYFTSATDQKILIGRAIIAMTATVVSWWFADRQIAKQIGRKLL